MFALARFHNGVLKLGHTRPAGLPTLTESRRDLELYRAQLYAAERNGRRLF
jgi:hypothetical protein